MIALLSFDEFMAELLIEAPNPSFVSGPILFYEEKPKNINDLVWCRNIWPDCQVKEFNSISEAAELLKANNFLWAHQPGLHHRRSTLIQDSLPRLKSRQLRFKDPLPPLNLGAWTLLDEKKIAYSARTSSPFPEGLIQFHEDTLNPPSRAYLKLWEALTQFQIKVTPGQKTIDLGSSPGGWTWVLAELGTHVVSVDKAALHPSLLKHPQVQHLKADAFNLDPQKIGPIDIIFSDVICYPDRLMEVIDRWTTEKLCYQFLVTLKFQGQTDFNVIRKFKEKYHAQVRHLCFNKHEATAWIKTTSP